MKLHTRRSRAKLVAENIEYRWFDYWKNESDKLEMLRDLHDLGPDPDPIAVDAITKILSCTRCKCDECDQDCEMVIELGEELYYESATAWVCRECLVKALEHFPLEEGKKHEHD